MVIGLTGQTGAGKTFVSDILSDKGYAIINADQVARQVVDKGTQCLVDLVLEFGIEILNEDGTLNRKKLGSVVFADKAKRMSLNRITFPYIHLELQEQIARYQRAQFSVIILDAPTLFESGADKYCDKVISVIAEKEIRLRRIVERDELTREDAENRINSQHDDDFYRTRSDYVIENNETVAGLRVKVLEMLEVLLGN